MFAKFRTNVSEVWDFLWAVIKSFGEHKCTLWSASLAYYGLFSMFPLLLFVVFFGSQFLQSDEARLGITLMLGPILPAYIEKINAIIDQTLQIRSSIGVLSGISLMWSGSSVFNVLESALGNIWGVTSRPFWRKRLLAMLSVLVLGVAFMASFFIAPIVSWISTAVYISNHRLVNVLIEMALGLITTYVIYRVFPNKSVKRQTALIAAVISTSLIEIVKTIFTNYLGSAFANYGAVYGSLAWIVALAFWAYIVSMLFFFGAEVAVELRRREVI